MTADEYPPDTERAIRSLGGRYGPPLELPALSVRIVWCEGGVVAINADGHARWSYETGLVDELWVERDGIVALESGGAVFRLDATDGSRVAAA